MEKLVEQLKASYKKLGIEINSWEKREGNVKFELEVGEKKSNMIIKKYCDFLVMVIDPEFLRKAKKSVFSLRDPKKKWVEITDEWLKEVAIKKSCKSIVIYIESFFDTNANEVKGYFKLKNYSFFDSFTQLWRIFDNYTDICHVMYIELEKQHYKNTLEIFDKIRETFEKNADVTDYIDIKEFRKYWDETHAEMQLYYKGKYERLYLDKNETGESYQLIRQNGKVRYFDNLHQLEEIMKGILDKIEKAQRVKNVLVPPREYFDEIFQRINEKARESLYEFLLKDKTPHEIEKCCVVNKGKYIRAIETCFKFYDVHLIQIEDIFVVSLDDEAFVTKDKMKAKEKMKENAKLVMLDEINHNIDNYFQKELA